MTPSTLRASPPNAPSANLGENKRKIAAVLGGGPSLPKDLKRLPEGCVLISVNDHAFHHCEPDVLVFQDKLKWAPAVVEVLKTFKGVVVSPQPESHVQLPKGWWDGNQSSCLATWYACWMGYETVILCGMDCYQGAVKYCHPRPGFDHPIFKAPLEKHLELWADAFDKCPHPERIQAASGPLVEVFGRYEPGKLNKGTYVRKPKMPMEKPAWLEKIRVRIDSPTPSPSPNGRASFGEGGGV